MHSHNTSMNHSPMDCIAEETVFSIGEAAKRIGSTIKTVRYYDEIGLVKPSRYTEGGHRLYTAEDIRLLELTAALRYMDFGIDDIRHIIYGEVPVDAAIDEHIQSLELQVRTLTNMMALLHQAKEQGGDALRYLVKLVHTRTVSAEQREQYISEKVEESHLFKDIPVEWRDPVLYFFNKYVVHQPRTTAKQTAAWLELQTLMSDPQFIADLKKVELQFSSITNQPRYHASLWIKKIEDVQSRLNLALKQQYTAGSKAVQSIIDEMALLHANSKLSRPKESFFHAYAQYIESTRTTRLERCNALCAIISPQYRQLYKGSLLLYRGVQWRLQHQ